MQGSGGRAFHSRVNSGCKGREQICALEGNQEGHSGRNGGSKEWLGRNRSLEKWSGQTTEITLRSLDCTPEAGIR